MKDIDVKVLFDQKCTEREVIRANVILTIPLYKRPVFKVISVVLATSLHFAILAIRDLHLS